LKKTLELCNQPAAYAANRLRVAEKMIASLTSTTQALEKELQECRNRLKISLEETGDVKQRLVVVLQQRGEVDKLTKLLEIWRQQQKHHHEHDDADDENDMGDVEDDEDALETDVENSRQLHNIRSAVAAAGGHAASDHSSMHKPVVHSHADTVHAHHQTPSRPPSAHSTPTQTPRLAHSHLVPQQTPPTSSRSNVSTSSAGGHTPVDMRAEQARARSALASLTPEQISRMTTRPTAEPSPHLLEGAINSDSYNAGKPWFHRTNLDE
jgi:hypothetical protein